MPAYQIRVGGVLDGGTPYNLPATLPTPVGGVVKLDANVFPVGALDLSELARQPGSSVWVRAFHVEYAPGTLAARALVQTPGSLQPSSLAPVIATTADPLLMRPVTLSPQTLLPPGSVLLLRTDDVGPDFADNPVAGPHYVYIDVVPVFADEDRAAIVDMASAAAVKMLAQGNVMRSVQQVAADAEETIGMWVSPINDRVGSNTSSGQLGRASVVIGDAAAAGESMTLQLFADFGGSSTLLGQVLIDDSVAANSQTDIPIRIPSNELSSGALLRVARSYTAGMAPTPMTNTVVRVEALPAVTGDLVGTGIPSATATITMVPMSRLESEESMRDQGLVGLLTSGHYFTLGTTRYVWFDGGAGSFDPGPVDVALAGRSGIRVPIPAGNHSAADVAGFVAPEIVADGLFTATNVGDDVQVVGTNVAAFGAVDWDSASFGILGMRYGADLIGDPDFDAALFRASRLDPADLPANPFVVTGMRVVVGGTHTDQLTAAIYQGGAADGDYQNAVLLGVLGTTTGTDTDTLLFAPTESPFLVDPAGGRLWVAFMHDSGTFTLPFPGTTSPAGTTSNYAGVGSTGVFVSSGGPASSDPADFPALAPAVSGTTFTTFPPISLSYVERDAFPNDMTVVGRFGTRQTNPALFTSTSNDTLHVGNSFTSPNLLGMTVRSLGVAYDTHVLNSDYRVSFAVGGLTDDNFTGAVDNDVGRAGEGTTNTGWNDRAPGAPIAIPPASRVWICIHFDASGSVLAFVDDGDPTNTLSPPDDPAAFLNDNPGGAGAPECEVDDGTLGGTPTTNYTFDPATPQVSPYPVPNGTIYLNDNYVGIRGQYIIDGAAIAVSP